jgi:hypothetical protein
MSELRKDIMEDRDIRKAVTKKTLEDKIVNGDNATALGWRSPIDSISNCRASRKCLPSSLLAPSFTTEDMGLGGGDSDWNCFDDLPSLKHVAYLVATSR